MSKPIKKPTFESVLREFVKAIDHSGGLARQGRGQTSILAAAPTLTGVAITYKKACQLLRITPKWFDGVFLDDDPITDVEEYEPKCPWDQE